MFLSLFFLAKTFPIRNAWTNCAEYDTTLQGFKISTVCDKFVLTPDNKLKHLPSNSCVIPESTSDQSKLKLDPKCNDINSVFQQTAAVQLKHVNSGMCIYPLRGGTNPPTGTELVINENCDIVPGKLLQMTEGNYGR